MKNIGLIYAIAAYTLWGVIPIFWKQLAAVDSFEIVAHRMLWSCLCVLMLVFVSQQWRELTSVLRDKKVVLRLVIAALLVSLNWAIFIWAVNAGHIVEASMGYFINPLISVLFGVLIFKEELRPFQWLAIAIMITGVGYLILVHGKTPYIALSLAATFSCYGAIKKVIKVPATHGLAIETSFMVLPAIAYLLYLNGKGVGSFGEHMNIDILLVIGGILTLIPLLLFAAAAKRISMTALGMSQYIGPTLQLIIGIWVYNESFGQEWLISFGLIWLALLIYSVDQLSYRHRIAITA